MNGISDIHPLSLLIAFGLGFVLASIVPLFAGGEADEPKEKRF